MGKDVPIKKKAPPSRKSKAVATHAAPGVNGHGIHGIHGPQPNPQNFFPLHPPTFSGKGGNTTSGAGLRGSVFSVDSVAHPGWGGRVKNRPFNHLPHKSRMNLIKGTPFRIATCDEAPGWPAEVGHVKRFYSVETQSDGRK